MKQRQTKERKINICLHQSQINLEISNPVRSPQLLRDIRAAHLGASELWNNS
uniref:Uncharacterized protein n=1 Tax=Anguilla anguilla TaxID=7936 RepID=A0A0E9XWX9_ANGAN